MKDILYMNSLSSYVNSAGNKFFLNLFWAGQDSPLFEENASLSSAVGDSDPLARLIESRLVSDAGSDVKKLFLLVQRDVYSLKNDALRPFNNIDVRNAWRKSFAFYTDPKRNDESFVVLSDQVSEKGDILPFPSLFYCKTRKVFFHPPCPSCGRPLHQCEDDSLLGASGLHPFSTSLWRYLHCPACGTPDFYTYEREPDNPPFLKGRQNLIQNFAGLKKADGTTAFPCADCQFHAECYDGGNRAQERIVPFSFYPFYMLAFEAASLNAIDFIPLLSGAGFQEAQSLVESSRQSGRIASMKALIAACAGNSPFLFDQDERHFLEILYLKLAFLEEVIRNFQSGGRFAHPDIRPGIDQIWVKFPENCGMLPWFWNFRVRILGVGREESAPRVFKMTPDAGVFLGLIWFYTLLSNKRQNMSGILNGLKKYPPDDADSFEKMTKENIFDSSNIFWDPQGKAIPDAWKSFWEKSLRMGWSLLTSRLETADDAGEKFPEQLAGLRKDIKENLFLKEIPYAASAPKEVDPVLPRTKDEAIHDILLGLIDKFQSVRTEKQDTKESNVSDAPQLTSAEKAGKAPAPPVDEEIEEPMIETVIFSARSSAREGAVPSAEETQIIAKHAPSREVPLEFQETQILSLKTLEPKAKPKVQESNKSEETLILSLNDLEPKTKPKTKEADQLEETLILSTQTAVKETPVPPAEKIPKFSQTLSVRDVPVENQETLILSVGNLDRQKEIKIEKTVPDIEETVILSTFAPGAKETRKTQEETRQEMISHGDLLDETVILRPGEKSKDGAKK